MQIRSLSICIGLDPVPQQGRSEEEDGERESKSAAKWVQLINQTPD